MVFGGGSLNGIVVGVGWGDVGDGDVGCTWENNRRCNKLVLLSVLVPYWLMSGVEAFGELGGWACSVVGRVGWSWWWEHGVGVCWLLR